MTNEFKPLDEALARLFTTIESEKEKRAAALEGQGGKTDRRPVGREGGKDTALIIDFAQWKRARQRGFTLSPRTKA